MQEYYMYKAISDGFFAGYVFRWGHEMKIVSCRVTGLYMYICVVYLLGVWMHHNYWMAISANHSSLFVMNYKHSIEIMISSDVQSMKPGKLLYLWQLRE